MGAQFALAGVTMDATKFIHALVGLDGECFAPVADMYSYARLKNQLIRRLLLSETARLRQ